MIVEKSENGTIDWKNNKRTSVRVFKGIILWDQSVA